MAGAAITHFEIHVDDIEKAKKFYSEVFGWSFTDANMGPGMQYWLIGTGRTTGANDQPAGIDGGLVQRQDAPADDKAAPNALVITVQVDDVEATVEKIKANGGSVYTDRMDIPGVGLWYGVKDPAKNHLGILQSPSPN